VADARGRLEETGAEAQGPGLALALRLVIVGLFVLGWVPLVLNCSGLWPAAVQFRQTLALFLLVGPSASIVFVALVGYFWLDDKDSRRWFIVAAVLAVGWGCSWLLLGWIGAFQ